MAATPDDGGYGCWPPMAGSSPSVTPSSTAPPVGCTSTLPPGRCRPPQMAAGTGWWPPTVGSWLFGDGPVLRVDRRPVGSTSLLWEWPPSFDGSGLLAGGIRRRDLCLRQRALLRLYRRPPAAEADRRLWRRPPDGAGYWLAASDGGIFNFGAAAYFGSTGGMPIRCPGRGHGPGPPTARGTGSSERDGGIFSFGDAGFYGSTGGLRLNRPIVGMAARQSLAAT